MEQVKKNKAEILETIREYGEMPINPERAAFLANCWAAYNALCMICGEEGSKSAARTQTVTEAASARLG